MKNNRLNHLFSATALGSVIFLAVACSDKKPATDTSASLDKPAQSPSALPATPNPAPAAAGPMAADQSGAAADGWAAIKDDTFEQRTHFSSGLRTMESSIDSRIAALNSMHGAMGDGKPNANLTEVAAARTNLQATMDKLDQATADTWTNDKDMVGQAWVRMQAACMKAQSN